MISSVGLAEVDTETEWPCSSAITWHAVARVQQVFLSRQSLPQHGRGVTGLCVPQIFFR